MHQETITCIVLDAMVAISCYKLSYYAKHNPLHVALFGNICVPCHTIHYYYSNLHGQ